MPEKPIVPALAALHELFKKISGQDGNSPGLNVSELLQSTVPSTLKASEITTSDNPNLELCRIANTLERIALALEKLNLDEADELTEISRDDDEAWITLPYATPNQPLPASSILKQTAPVATPSAKVAGSKPVATPAASPVLVKATTGPTADKVELAAPLITPPQNSVLLKYLYERGITVREQKNLQNKPQQAALDKLALHLGQNFATCQGLYELLKSNRKAPRDRFDYSLAGHTAEQNKIVRDFGRLLKEAELLEECTYQGRPDFKMQLKATDKEQKYLNGSWLECYAKLELSRIMQPYAISTRKRYEALANLEIIFEDNSKTELDLFFALGEQVFCLEAKLRPSRKDLETYLNKVERLRLANKDIVVIVADKTEEACQELRRALGEVRIARLTDFEQTIISLLKEQHAQ